MQFALRCEQAGYHRGAIPEIRRHRCSNTRTRTTSRDTGNRTRIILAAHGVILLVIVALVANYPVVSEWVSAAAQAEFVNSDMTSGSPTQLAQPAEQMRIVRSN